MSRLANVTFTWPAVAGTGVTYQFALAQASANTTANEFAILDYSDNTITNAEPNQETLAYNTVYWWEVRAVTMNSSGGIAATGPWSIQMFTTMPMPATTTAAPAITVTNTEHHYSHPADNDRTVDRYQCGHYPDHRDLHSCHPVLLTLGGHRSRCDPGHRRHRPDRQNPPHPVMF